MTSKQCCKFRNPMHTGNKISSFHQRHNFNNLKSDLFLVTFTRERLKPVQSYTCSVYFNSVFIFSNVHARTPGTSTILYTGYISVQFLFLVTVMHNRWRLAVSTIFKNHKSVKTRSRSYYERRRQASVLQDTSLATSLTA